MNPWCYLIMLGWVAGSVSSWLKASIWLPVLAAVVLSGLVDVYLKGSVLPSLPGQLPSVETIAYSAAGVLLLPWMFRPSGVRGKKAKGK